MALDSQQIEIVGRHLLIANLIAAGIEVAEPIRDRGVDLIAFRDGRKGERFDAWPIQLKASLGKAFSLDKKYKDFHRLLVVYAWNVADPEKSELFALTYQEATQILDQMGYSSRVSWTKGGRWAVTKVGADLEKRIKPYKMNTEAWKDKFLAIG
jgi:hypothetical protein